MRGNCSGCGLEDASGDTATDPALAATRTIVVTTTRCSKTETMAPERAVLARCGSRGAGRTRHSSDLWFGTGFCSVRLLPDLALIRNGTGAYSWRLSETIPRVEEQKKCHESPVASAFLPLFRQAEC